MWLFVCCQWVSLHNRDLFTNVRKKFFTIREGRENKEATKKRSSTMQDIKDVILRSRGTLVQDAAGAAALVVMLVGCLYLPGWH